MIEKLIKKNLFIYNSRNNNLLEDLTIKKVKDLLLLYFSYGLLAGLVAGIGYMFLLRMVG